MTINPLISVIINCHNGEKYLSKCIKSILAQTYKNWEIVFWDNCSTDNSKKIIKNFKDTRIKYFKSKHFTSLYAARNLALKKTKGDYVSFLDTDDWWDKKKLLKQISIIKLNNDPKIIYSNVCIVHQNKGSKKLFSKVDLPTGHITQKLLNDYKVGLLTILVKKEIFKKTNFNEKYNIIGDFDFVIKLSVNTKFFCVQEPLAFYRIHEENLFKKGINLYISELKDWLISNSKYFKKNKYSLFMVRALYYKLVFKQLLQSLFKKFI